MKELRHLKKQLAKARQHPHRESDDCVPTFQEVVKDIKPLKQDKIPPVRKRRVRTLSYPANGTSYRSEVELERQLAASFSFSDVYQGYLPDEGPVRYCRPDVPTHLLKQLRRGDFFPELVLDLHGLSRESAKLELAALIYTARKETIDCVSVMHGKGKGILKNALPHYLIQHPHVKAFHQATLEYGGQSALLVLVDTADETTPE